MIAPGLLKAADTVQQAAATVTLPDWSNVVSPATIIAIITNGAIVALFLRKQGAKEALNDAGLSDCREKMKVIRDDFESAKSSATAGVRRGASVTKPGVRSSVAGSTRP
jgi:hypothetical protein